MKPWISLKESFDLGLKHKKDNLEAYKVTIGTAAAIGLLGTVIDLLATGGDSSNIDALISMLVIGIIPYLLAIMAFFVLGLMQKNLGLAAADGRTMTWREALPSWSMFVQIGVAASLVGIVTMLPLCLIPFSFVLLGGHLAWFTSTAIVTAPTAEQIAVALKMAAFAVLVVLPITIYLSLGYLFYTYALLEGKRGFMESLELSWRMSAGRRLNIFWVTSVLGLFASLSTIPGSMLSGAGSSVAAHNPAIILTSALLQTALNIWVSLMIVPVAQAALAHFYRAVKNAHESESKASVVVSAN